MGKKYINKSIGAHFSISDELSDVSQKDEKLLMFIWNDSFDDCRVKVDGQIMILKPDMVICTTYLHKLHIDNFGKNLKYLQFNREFYCIHTNDSEVSCNGLLFFGSDFVPAIVIPDGERESFRTLFGVLTDEFDNNATGQEEMLRILLKRFIIKCTRLANDQIIKNGDNKSEIDLIRNYNVLVEEHFKNRKSVKSYAELMYKSPKTIANIFSKNSDRTPLEVIHNRIIIEAKRMLLYTNKTSKEIGMELGYDDPAQFSKLFKKQAGMTTTNFRKSKHEIPYG